MNFKTKAKDHHSKFKQFPHDYKIGNILSPRPGNSIDKKSQKLFKSGNIKAHAKRQSGISDQPHAKLSNKVVTTDQSNNGIDSKLQQSVILNHHKIPNQEYFHQPLTFGSKKLKKTNHAKRQTRLNQISLKLDQMSNMVCSQQKQLKQMKSSMNQRQLSRLIKIHSIQKLRLVNEMQNLKMSSIRSSKKL